MDTPDFVRRTAGFTAKNHPDKIKAFGWFLHTSARRDRFSAVDIRRCYDEAHLAQPANTNRFLEALTEKRPPELLRDARGYRLAQDVREQLDRELGAPATFVVVEKMLLDLPGRIADDGERLFLVETLSCYRAGAFRATIVMAWNLAYDHLARWVLANSQRLDDFNAGIAKRNSKKAHVKIVDREDFADLKEDEVIDIVGGLPGFPGDVKKLMKEKLGRRNTFAHPSTIKVERPQADDMITDLVNNVVLYLRL